MVKDKNKPLLYFKILSVSHSTLVSALNTNQLM